MKSSIAERCSRYEYEISKLFSKISGCLETYQKHEALPRKLETYPNLKHSK